MFLFKMSGKMRRIQISMSRTPKIIQSLVIVIYVSDISKKNFITINSKFNFESN